MMNEGQMTVDTATKARIFALAENSTFLKFNLKIQKGKKVNREKLVDFLLSMDEDTRKLALAMLDSSARSYKRSIIKPRRGIGSY